MIRSINIQNLVLVKQLNLELYPNMTILTGETGAGKSILLNALGLALGDRADHKLIRTDCKQAEISISFELKSQSSVQTWLQQHDLETTTESTEATASTKFIECHVRRIMTKEGRSRAYINNHSVPIQSLKTLGEQLVDIHSQHAHHSLMQAQHQRQLLDNYAQHKDLLQQVKQCYQQWQQTIKTWQTLKANLAQQQARLELLQYQITELQALQPQADEWEQLELEQQQLAQAQQLEQSCYQTLNSLYEAEEHTIYSEINRCIYSIEPFQTLARSIQSALDCLHQALIQIEEAQSELKHSLNHIEHDPNRLEEIDARMVSFQELARKHKIQPQQLPQHLETLIQEYQQLSQQNLDFEQLQQQQAQYQQQYETLCQQLSNSRQQAANKLATKVTELMQQLGLQQGHFDIAITPTKPSRYGQDEVQFLVTANPGQPLRPLQQVASGGELSRISLAIQVITADNSHSTTLIYDEVDTGISGKTAEIVGRLLKQLANSHQVLCITHLPQVASQGQQHLQVSKRQDNHQTYTQITPLTPPQRVQEIARMLGGIQITKQTLAHAEEMLMIANQ